MINSPSEKARLFETILENLRVAVTYVDSDGVIVYANRAAHERPSSVPRQAGTNIADCHRESTNRTIARMFAEFRKGRRDPHHYVGSRLGYRELVTIIPVFDGDSFAGCFSQIYPLELHGPERSF